jgi:hypothetical protein
MRKGSKIAAGLGDINKWCPKCETFRLEIIKIRASSLEVPGLQSHMDV